ncbi:unnamed protein product [Closterium sp. NIES-53]
MASMAGTHELKEAMEMRMRALGVQLQETRKELEAERRRVSEMGEVRGQVEERGGDLAAVKGELAAVQGELAAMKRELAEHKDAMAEQVEARKESSEIREELAALKRDLRRQRDLAKSQIEEADKRHGQELIEPRGQVEERKRELEKAERRRVAEMAAELAAVKGALAGHKDSVIEQLRMTERRRESGFKELIEEVRKKEDEMRAELAIKREERREEVQELNWPRAMEELAAYRNWRRSAVVAAVAAEVMAAAVVAVVAAALAAVAASSGSSSSSGQGLRSVASGVSHGCMRGAA